MNRLQAELHRLYGIAADQHATQAPSHPAGGAPAGDTRVMVLEVQSPPGWEALGPVWEAVQTELELPRPGIAVSGRGTFQLWFSLAEPLPRVEAEGFLQRLRRRFLGAVRAERVAIHTGVGEVGGAGGDTRTPGTVPCVAPPVQSAPDRWSAFLSPDLTAVFAEEPWLDIPPGIDAQADVLARLQTTRVADLRRAAGRLLPEAAEPASPVPDMGASRAGEGAQADPKRFLLGVMNDPSVALALRIDAAKALLAAPGEMGPR